MPYAIKKSDSGYFVVNKETGKKMNKKPHSSKNEASSHLKALYANVEEAVSRFTFDDTYDQYMQRFQSSILDKETLNPLQIAQKHKVPVEQIMRQLKMGIKTEQEHTSNIEVAKEIALDHLKEDPKYYSKLHKMEG